MLHRKTFFIIVFLLLCALSIKDSPTQTLKVPPLVTDIEIKDLAGQIRLAESKILPIDAKIRSLEENHEKVINDITSLKEQMREPKSFFGKVTGVFGGDDRKLRKLMAESQDMSDRITELQLIREPIIKDLDRLTTRLINRSETKINALMDIIVGKEPNADRASDQISALLQLTKKVSDLRNKYIAEPTTQTKASPFLSSLANDPEKLRLGAILSKNMAQKSRAEAEKKKNVMRNLQTRQKVNEKLIEKYREIQRSNEEKEAGGAESGTTGLPFSFNESEFGKTINAIKKNIERLSNEIRDLEEEAKNFENQSKIFEQRASQIESMR
jgi:archaellum component FlaC